ncbi:MAG: gluconate kinase [Saprospiraceae bacterium]|nr:MAG: gluconate kinase [Saprospiraceae bacterium]
MHYLLPIDIGTTSTKILAVSTQGRTLAKVDKSYPTLHPEPDWSEQDPELIVTCILEGIHEVVKKVGTPPLAVSFSCAMHSLIAMDHSGNALTRAILWSDARSRPQAEQLKSGDEGNRIYQQTGTPIHAMSPLCKLIWFRENQPEVLKKTACFIDIKGYVLHRLFGEYLIDYSLASATGLFAVQQKKWYPPAVALAGISIDQLPKPVPTYHQLNDLPSKFCQQTGLLPKTPFVIGASDGCLANLGAMALDGSALAITLGTSGAIRTGSIAPFLHPEGKTFSYHLDDQLYINGGPSNNGGNVFAWIQQSLFNGLASDQVFEKLTAVPPGAEGLLCLPWLHGERAPLWNEQATGGFLGLRPQHGPANMGRAALEALAMNLYTIFEDLKAIPNIAVQEIRINGGLARSPLVRQIIADVFDLPVHLLVGTDGSALGAAMLAMRALGLIQNYHELDSWISTTSLSEPHLAHQLIYQERYAMFQMLSRKLQLVTGKV